MSNMGKELYEFGPFRLDSRKRVLMRDNQPVPLQLKAFETLLVLVRNSEPVSYTHLDVYKRQLESRRKSSAGASATALTRSLITERPKAGKLAMR